VVNFNYQKCSGPAPAAGDARLPGRGRNRIVALSRVNAVFANDVRQLGQKLPKPGVLLDQRMGFVGPFVATQGGLVPAKGILKQ
jgi:hypothetical protein